MEFPSTDPSQTIHTTLPPTTQRPPRTLTSYLTLDLLIRILSRSIFHPAITLIAYLCIAAVHKHREPVAYYVLYWSAFLVVLEILAYLNRRIAYGPPRRVEWEDEVVVITGGGSGLGRVLMEGLVMRGVKVAVLDVRGVDSEARELMEGGSGELCWVQCDVGREEEVKGAVERVVKELGRPTVLVNNAAGRVNALGLLPVLDDRGREGDGEGERDEKAGADAKTTALSTMQARLAPAQAAATLQTNALAHFNTLHHVLPHILAAPNGGHIITISSIISHLAPSHLADYTASKAAISSLHASLTHEILSHPDPWVRNNIKTLLVEVGQMDTGLFGGGLTKLPGWTAWWGTVVEGMLVARWITWYIERGEGGVVRLPVWARVVGRVWGIVPVGVRRVVRAASGIDAAVRQR